MTRFFVSGAVVAALMAVMTPTPARAITYDKMTYLTFSAPVQVPGVTLNAGTYRFHLTNESTGRSVIQVLSGDGSTVYSMFLTTPDSRMKVTDEATVTFMETPAGVPVAVKSLFYGGEHLGYGFVYPKGGPIMTAEFWPQPEITYSLPPAVPEPVAEVEVTPFVLHMAPALTQEPAAPVELPRTASPLPLAAVGGLTSLLAGIGLGLLRRRAS